MHEKLFVISPIGEQNSPRRKDADAVLNTIIRPAARSELAVAGSDGIDVERGDHDPTPGEIMLRVVDNILESTFVAVVVSEANPNVFYEVGVAHAAGRRLLIAKHKDFTTPFDVVGHRYVEYDKRDLENPEHARRSGGPVEQFAKALAAEREQAHRSGQYSNPFNRPEIGPLGRERILDRFRDLKYEDWSKIFLNAEQEIWIAGMTLLELANNTSFFMPGPDGELIRTAGQNLGNLLGYAVGRGVRVTMLMMHPENPALPEMLMRAPHALETAADELIKVREDLDVSYRRWITKRATLAKRASPEQPELRAAEDAWQIIRVRSGIVPQRITLTEREVVTTPYFCALPYNSGGPAIRAKAGHPWHTYFRQELQVLAACNTPPQATGLSMAAG
jgi:hypothetical protein